MISRDLVVVGGGPAGMAAALSAHENGVKDILVLERDNSLGGILNQCIHTGFGLEYFKKVLTGPEYADKFIKEIEKIPEIEVSLNSFVVHLRKDRTLTYSKPGRMEEIKAKTLIMATGCRERTREMIHIAGTRPAGIFSAGLAQKLINIEGLLPGKKAVIVGTGDIGLIMARRFVIEGAKVSALVEIQKKSTGLVRNMVQCVEDFDIPVYFQYKISRIYGNERVEKVQIVKVNEQFNEISGTEQEIECDTVLVSAGLVPENDLMEEAGVIIDDKTRTPVSEEINKTSIPGLYVCGNACMVYDIVDSVTRDSKIAGRYAAEYLRTVAGR